MATKELATKAPTALQKAGMYDDYSGATGFENADRDSYAIPFIKVIQKISSQMDESSTHYNPDAKAGMLVQTATGEIFKSILVVPVYYRRVYIEWKPRASGGGFVAEHNPTDIDPTRYAQQGGVLLTDRGTELHDTRMHYALLISEHSYDPVIISFSSTQLKKSKQWMTKMQSLKLMGAKGAFTPPMFSHIYELSTVLEKNDKGSWHGYKIETHGMQNDPDCLLAAKALIDAINKGTVVVKHDDPTIMADGEQSY